MGLRATTFFAALLAVALISGCGSSSSTGSDSGTTSLPSGPLTRAAFVKVGNEICVAAAKRRDQDLKEAAGSSGEGGSAEMNSIVEVALESVKDLAGELAELQPPAVQKKETAALVKSLEREMRKFDATPTAALGGTAFQGSNAAARRAGLPECVI